MTSAIFDSLHQKPLKVIIAGSKDNPKFPQYEPDIFVGAHGGIYHAKRFSDSTIKYGVLSNYFLCSSATYCKTVNDLIQGVNLDFLIIIESIPRDLEDILPESIVNLSSRSIIRLSTLECSCLELRYLGLSYISALLATLSIRRIMGFLKQLYQEKTSYLTRLSTGLFSVLYFYHILSPGSTVNVVGIGLQLSGSYFFDPTGNMKKGGHYSQDLFIATKLSTGSDLSNSVSVSFTDPDAQKAIRSTTHISIRKRIKIYLESIYGPNF